MSIDNKTVTLTAKRNIRLLLLNNLKLEVGAG